MRASIIKGFLPWIVFFSFADGSALGIKIGTIGALFSLFLFNRGALRKGFFLDWSTLSFFVFLPILGVGFHHPIVIKYGLLWANVALTFICVLSLAFWEPVTLQYTRLTTDKSYWDNPMLLRVNYWVTFWWGCTFLFSSVIVGLYGFDIGTKVWMIEILPTAFLVGAIAFTIVFPDIYHVRVMAKASGIFRISKISPIQHVHFNNIDIGYRTMGRGPLIVLVQDAYMNMHAWDSDFLRQLARDFELIIFDYPGIGYSSFNKISYTATSLADCVHAMIDTLNLKPLAILGVGVGGYIAQTFATLYSSQIQSLILINTPVSGKEAVRSEISQEELETVFLQDRIEKTQSFMPLFFPAAVIPRLENKMSKIFLSEEVTGKISPEIVERFHQLMAKWYQDDRLLKEVKKLSLPTLIVVGKQDILVPPKNAQWLARHLTYSTLVEYDDAGHGVINQYPSDVADQIKTFLTSLR